MPERQRPRTSRTKDSSWRHHTPNVCALLVFIRRISSARKYDMIGNFWEYLADCWQESLRRVKPDVRRHDGGFRLARDPHDR